MPYINLPIALAKVLTRTGSVAEETVRKPANLRHALGDTQTTEGDMLRLDMRMGSHSNQTAQA